MRARLLVMATSADHRPLYIVRNDVAGRNRVLYEGVPQFQMLGAPGAIAERLRVNIFHTSPTHRMLRKAGGDEPQKYNYPFQTHDHRRRAYRAGSMEVVPTSRRQRPKRIVDTCANRDRRLSVTTKPRSIP